MLKVISKQNCERCENVKNYLTQRGIQFEVEMAEDRGYEYWREFIMTTTGKLGFPLLCHTVSPEHPTEYINGSTEEIIEQINKWYLINKQNPQVQPDITKINWDWGTYDTPPETNKQQ